MRFRAPMLPLLATLLIAAAAPPPPATALDSAGQEEFRTLLGLSMRALADRAGEVIWRKYRTEDWAVYNFPRYVYTAESTEIAYRIAVKEPETLAVAVCACFCDEMGHKTLAYCFLKDGKPAAGYDDHAASCNICVRQALLAFLWADQGASSGEIQQAMQDAFGAP